MKILASILVVVIISITNIITAQNKTIIATVLNISSDKGIVKFALYNKTNFRLKPLQSEIGNIENGKTTITFKEVAGGEYAIVCYHDKNSNDKMDFQPNGMPLEAYGASNNVMNFGPPKFDDAKFTVVDKNVSLEIKF
ncbi:DUF2141 domain-containing protein [Polaribacter sp.]|uniref:DUF2141 domain-containing protein n=1 Tax=uncultured Polaribacter sp. TaxID=174711 RepID=UPI002338E762|nr:DUF2141 domain-containing protein [Polaribacter sp.]